MNYAIREMLELLGMNTVDGLTESDIIKGSPSVVGMLHKWTVAICLGLHFHQGMYLSGGSTPAKYDENNSRVMSESIRDQTKSTIDDALNILTYITLENIQYPRLARISLDSNQDARELFLAFAFLICTYQWFNKIEKRSPEYLGFRKCLASAVDEDVDKMIVAQQQGLHSPKTTVENLASLLIPFTNRHDITYDCVYDGLTLPAAITTGFCPSTSNIKKQHSKIDLQKVSDTDNSGRARGKVSPALNDRITTNFALEPTKVVPTKSDKSQTVGIPSWALTPANYTQHKKNDAGAAEDVSSATFRMLEEVHHAILRVSADFEAKSKLLCRSKNVESFDSELLRIVIGQSKQELSFNNLMYSNGIGALCYRGRKCDGGVSNEKHRGPADKKSIQNLKRDDEIQSLMDEIKQLSHTIVQEQYRFRRLLHSLEQGDGERLNLFSGLLGNHTSCDKPVAVRHKGEGNNPTFMGDDYIMPIPAEWVLISQKDPFERHMALLKMIARSLDSETDRSSFFDTALNILKQAKPETSTRRPATAKGSTSRKRISLVTTPNKIKDMVDTLKSFLVEGIPAANF
ncbi:family transcriptional regulator, putative [Babesia caballi]|nr:family transcriptional regulator, putative [Babesia caballi]